MKKGEAYTGLPEIGVLGLKGSMTSFSQTLAFVVTLQGSGLFVSKLRSAPIGAYG